MKVKLIVADQNYSHYAEEVAYLIEDSAKKRGTGIAKRSTDYIRSKIDESKAVLALDGDKLAGFSYIETWGKDFVANSGLIVAEEYRRSGLAKKIKKEVFELSRKKFPHAKIFGITTSLAVMKINSDLGYAPVTFSELTDDDDFWNGCRSCPNYHILEQKNRHMCLCTAMLYDPAAEKNRKPFNFQNKINVLQRMRSMKQTLLQKYPKNNNKQTNANNYKALASIRGMFLFMLKWMTFR